MALKRDQVWQRAAILQQLDRREAELRTALDEGLRGALGAARARADALLPKRWPGAGAPLDYESLGAAFVELSAVVAVAARRPAAVPPAEGEAALALARQILKRVNVPWRGSRLSLLHARTFALEASLAAEAGDTFRAHWCRCLADDRPDMMGEVTAALRELHAAPHAAPLGPPGEGHLARARRLRRAGDPFAAIQELALADRPTAALASDPAASPDDVGWERALSEAQITGELGSVVNVLRIAGARSSARVFSACLWASAVRTVAWLGRIPGRSTVALELGRSHPKARILEALGASYDVALSLEERLANLFQCAALSSSLETADDAALCLYAVCRALVRLKQRHLLPAVLRQLVLELRARNEPVPPAFDVAADLFTLEQVQTSSVERASEIGRLTARIGRILGPEGLSRLVFRPKELTELTEEQLVELAELVTDTMSRLKGPLMKTGQMLSYAVSRMPEAVAARFAALQRDSTPVAFGVIRGALEREYGRPVSEIFCELDPVPCGVGTIGQVHRARLASGEEVAVKVQFPDIRDAVSNDLRVLRVVLPVVDLLAPGMRVTALFEELARNLMEECDYRIEAESQRAFYELYASQAGGSHAARELVRVPKIHVDLCRERVLVTEYVRGVGFREFVSDADDARKGRAGQAIVYFVVAGMLAGLFNTDPHPGNYLFDRDGVWFVDYGSVKRWERREIEAWGKMTAAILDQDVRLFEEAVKEMGFVLDPSRFKYDKAFDTIRSSQMLMWAVEGEQTISPAAIHRQARNVVNVSKGTGKRSRKGRRRPNYRLPPELLLAFRVYFGHLSLLAHMNARANWNTLVRSILDESGVVARATM